MSKEKEIKEIADIIQLNIRMLPDFACHIVAEEIYKQGYRKQSDVEPVNRWISVDDRLPDVCGMPVLMVAVNEYGQHNVVKGFTDYACPIDFHTNEREYEGVWHAWKVTHWQPLPEPPESEVSDNA